MKISTDRILTTHTGSLARPPALQKMLLARDAGDAVDPATFGALVKQSVDTVVRQQLEAGIDVINDGEQSKLGFAAYLEERLSGFDGPELPRPVSLDRQDFPGS